MNPYFDDGKGHVIYHADCRDVLPTLEPVDLVLTDPPYGIGESNERALSRVKLAAPKDYGAFNWDKEPISQDLFCNVIGAGKWAAIFGGNYYVTQRLEQEVFDFGGAA